MSVPNDIITMVDRLKRADIPTHHICYELDEEEWQELVDYVGKFERYAGRDLSYIDDMTFMGLHIRKKNRTMAPEVT
jgi:hypothetical protein